MKCFHQIHFAENTRPLYFSHKILIFGSGKPSKTVRSFNALKSPQILYVPSGFAARCSADVHAFILFGSTGTIMPNLASSFQSCSACRALGLPGIIGRHFAWHGGLFPVSMRCTMPCFTVLVLKLHVKIDGNLASYSAYWDGTDFKSVSVLVFCFWADDHC